MADVLSAALPGAHRLQDISCEPPSAEGEVVGRNGELRRIHSPQGTAGVAAKNRPTDPLPTHGICFVADTPALALPSILERTCTRKLSDTCHARTSAARAPHRAQRYVTGKPLQWCIVTPVRQLVAQVPSSPPPAGNTRGGGGEAVRGS